MNRCLIVKSFYPSFQIQGQSFCDDVVAMEKAVDSFIHKKEEPLNCGAAGTTFRFLCARVTREIGSFSLIGEERLFERPHLPLFESLRGMGVTIEEMSSREMVVSSQGWLQTEDIQLGLEKSSQYISALLLSAWELKKPLVINIGESRHSFSYLQMTIDLLRAFGMNIEVEGHFIRVPAGQQLKVSEYKVEPDMSSIFALVSLALVAGKLELTDFPTKALQPDQYFLEILKEMNADFFLKEDTLQVSKAENLKPIKVNLVNNPDLFPVLAVLLSRVESRFFPLAEVLR